MTELNIDYTDVFGDDIAPDHTVSRRIRGRKRKLTIKEQFEAFHLTNPFVYDLLCKYARKVKAAGLNRCSMQLLMEQVRWYVTFEKYQYEPGKFKLNNNFCSHYARLIMEQEPDLHGLFATRVLKAA